LYSTTLQGAWSRLIPTFDGLQSEFRAQYSHDGAWIYFTGRPDHQNGEIWRVAPDGSGAARVGPTASWYDVDTQPSPSPDGTRVAFATNRTDFNTLYLRILDLATGSVFDPNVRGQLPRWSPQGDRIAYYDESEGGLKVMNPDGSQQRFVAFIGYPPNTALDWSPDGQWLVVGADGLVIVNVATGELLPIAGTTGYGRPSWHP
jgi:Tol biopolymer transport system component